MKIKFSPPDKTSPGFLRRLQAASEMAEQLKTGQLSPKLIDSLIDFLSPYIVSPEKKEEKREVLLDASEEDFNELLGLVTGGQELPKESGQPSETTTTAE